MVLAAIIQLAAVTRVLGLAERKLKRPRMYSVPEFVKARHQLKFRK